MQKIIITWGCGFIASNFLNTFVPRHPEITFLNLDAMTYAASQDNLDEATKNAPNYRFYQVDIRDMEALKEIYTLEQPTDIIHFAAESHVDNSIKNPNIFLETNILGTNNLLVLHKDFWMKRFHFISTDEVYGDLPLNQPELKFTEDTPLHPHSPYSTSKAGADMLVQAFHRTYGIDTTTSRCSNNYGPCQHREKLIPRFITQLMNNAKVPLYGDGMNIRDRIHVTDHNEGVWTIFSQAKSESIYNLGWLNEISNKEITYKLLEAFGKDESAIEFVPDRLGHDRRYAIDCSLIEQDFWWMPKYDFEKGLEETVEWYIER
jgi:dTDP-glucose 4,6-dehydratase